MQLTSHTASFASETPWHPSSLPSSLLQRTSLTWVNMAKNLWSTNAATSSSYSPPLDNTANTKPFNMIRIRWFFRWLLHLLLALALSKTLRYQNDQKVSTKFAITDIAVYTWEKITILLALWTFWHFWNSWIKPADSSKALPMPLDPPRKPSSNGAYTSCV